MLSSIFPVKFFSSSLFCLSHFSSCAFLHVVTTLFFLSIVPCYYKISFVISHNLPRWKADYSLITTESKRSYKSMISRHSQHRLIIIWWPFFSAKHTKFYWLNMTSKYRKSRRWYSFSQYSYIRCKLLTFFLIRKNSPNLIQF